MTVRLDRAQLEELAELVADALAARLDAGRRARLVDAATLAEELGLSRDTVYERAEELGAFRVGSGRRARLRFDPDEARRRLASCQGVRESAAGLSSGDAAAGAGSRRRRRSSSGASASSAARLLPVRDAGRG